MFRFERLDVWQEAISLSNRIYAVTKTFPSDELYGLRSQIRRAAVSIAANIAEGSGRVTDRDFSRFIEIAFGSLMETVSHLHIAQRQQFISQPEYESLYAECEKLAKMLSALRNRLKSESPN